jgi:hypothetical protein
LVQPRAKNHISSQRGRIFGGQQQQKGTRERMVLTVVVLTIARAGVGRRGSLCIDCEAEACNPLSGRENAAKAAEPFLGIGAALGAQQHEIHTLTLRAKRASESGRARTESLSLSLERQTHSLAL